MILGLHNMNYQAFNKNYEIDLVQSGVFYVVYLENDKNPLDMEGPHYCDNFSESVAVFKSLVQVNGSVTIYKDNVQ